MVFWRDMRGGAGRPPLASGKSNKHVCCSRAAGRTCPERVGLTHGTNPRTGEGEWGGGGLLSATWPNAMNGTSTILGEDSELHLSSAGYSSFIVAICVRMQCSGQAILAGQHYVHHVRLPSEGKGTKRTGPTE